MLQNAFIGKPEPPAAAELAAELGRSQALWDQLLAELEAQYGLTVQEWNSYSRKAGWSLRLKREQRNIVYLSPGRGGFTASFALGDRAVEAARRSKLPKDVLKLIGEAKRYAEGTAVRIEVQNERDVRTVATLAGLKLEH